VISPPAFSRFKSEQKLRVSANLLMMKADTIFGISDFRLELKRLVECRIISAKKGKTTDDIDSLQRNFFHVIQINKT
jgi:hypothetical protein